MAVSSGAVDAYLEDASGYRGETERVFLPTSVSEVEEIVREANGRAVPLTIAGAGTGLTGARVPHGGWVVSLERFRSIKVLEGSAVCGAGASLRDLQMEAAQSKQFLGPNPTEDLASIGGIIGTNAGGARNFRYGSVRRQVLALQVTFMNAETKQFRRGERVNVGYRQVKAPETTKNSAGYYLVPELEWVDLLSGSEGTLGIVTNAELRLLPEPPAILSGVVFFRQDEEAMEAVEQWRNIPELRLLEYMDENALAMLREAYSEIPAESRAALLVEQNLASEEMPEIDLWAKRLEATSAYDEESWFGFAKADRERFKNFRHHLAVTVVELARQNGFPKSGTDFAVPIKQSREFHAYCKQRCKAEFPGQFTIFGHAGDGNNHVNLLPRTPSQAAHVERLIREFAQFAVSLGGTVAAEHGIGKTKTELLKLMYSEDDIEAMRRVKRELDPQWLLGRGNIFDSW